MAIMPRPSSTIVLLLLSALLQTTFCGVLPTRSSDTSETKTHLKEEMSSSSEDLSSAEESDTDTPRVPKFNDRIAVIGAGPAGLFAARELTLRGYTRVKVFERASEVADVTRSFDVDGEAIDTTTRFIPNMTPMNMGIPEPLKSMIPQYGLSLDISGAIGFVNVNPPPPTPISLPHILGPPFVNDPTTIVPSLVWGFDILQRVDEKSVLECYAELNIAPGTTFQEWATTVNQPAFTGYAAYLHDAFLGGPAMTQDACLVLRVRALFMVNDIVNVLSAIIGTAPTGNTDLDAIRANVGYVGTRSEFTDGYQNFFNQIVSQEGLTVRLNKEVTKMRRVGNKHRLWINGNRRNKKYRHVVIAARPYDAVDFLPKNGDPLTQLYQKVFARPVYTSLLRTSGPAFPLPTTPVPVTGLLIYPQSIALGSPNTPTLPIAYGFEANDVMIMFGYSTDEDEATALAQIQQELGRIGRTVDEVLALEMFDYVAEIDETASEEGFFMDIDCLQGKKGIYMVGEAISGYGVASVAQQSISVIDRFFPQI